MVVCVREARRRVTRRGRRGATTTTTCIPVLWAVWAWGEAGNEMARAEESFNMVRKERV